MFKDESRNMVWQQVRQRGLQGFAEILTLQAMQAAAKRAGVQVGTSPLNACTLVWLGIVGAIHKMKNFADVLSVTFKLLEDAQCPLPKPEPQPAKKTGRRKTSKKKGGGRKAKKGARSKHDPRGTSDGVSEEAFAQARQKMPLEFWMCLLLTLTENFQQQHPEYVRWKRFRLLMLDGSDIALQGRKKLLDHYGAAGSGTPRTPQARMVMLAMAQSRMPLRYEVGPQSCHEQTMARRLLQDLSVDDLILMDRGFWNYGLFWQIQQQGAYFGIRLRKGVSLRRIKWLRRNKDELVEWTPAKRSKKQCTWAGMGLPKSITLRVVHYQVRGFQPSAVVTNVLNPSDISRDEWVRMASVDEEGVVLEAGLYHRRWEIETMFNELKNFQGMKGKLRSRTPQGIEFEIAGHVLLYLLIRWLMVEAGQKHDAPPLQLSFKHALQEFEDLRLLLIISSPEHVRQVLLPKLLARIASHRITVRPGRHYPRPADSYKSSKSGKGGAKRGKKT